MTSAYPSPKSKSAIEPAPIPSGERSGGGPRAPGVGIISRHAVSEEEVGVAELLRERAARIVGDVRRGSALKPSCFLLGRPSRVPSSSRSDSFHGQGHPFRRRSSALLGLLGGSSATPLSVKLAVRDPYILRERALVCMSGEELTKQYKGRFCVGLL